MIRKRHVGERKERGSAQPAGRGGGRGSDSNDPIVLPERREILGNRRRPGKIEPRLQGAFTPLRTGRKKQNPRDHSERRGILSAVYEPALQKGSKKKGENRDLQLLYEEPKLRLKSGSTEVEKKHRTRQTD